MYCLDFCKMETKYLRMRGVEVQGSQGSLVCHCWGLCSWSSCTPNPVTRPEPSQATILYTVASKLYLEVVPCFTAWTHGGPDQLPTSSMIDVALGPTRVHYRTLQGFHSDTNSDKAFKIWSKALICSVDRDPAVLES